MYVNECKLLRKHCLLYLLGGKEAMKSGTEAFNKAASNAYKDVSSAQKEAMVAEAVISSKVLTSKEIRKQGKHIFGRIEKLVRFAD